MSVCLCNILLCVRVALLNGQRLVTIMAIIGHLNLLHVFFSSLGDHSMDNESAIVRVSFAKQDCDSDRDQ